jgi:hypothetical protein
VQAYALGVDSALGRRPLDRESYDKRESFQRFTVSIKELAEWFGLEVARIVVDECLEQREN